MQINSLKDSLKHVRIDEARPHNFSVPKSPNPKPQQKVVGVPTRTPVNKQAALLISPVKCWLSQPVREVPKIITAAEFAKIGAALKTERNDHAITRDDLGRARAEIRRLKEKVSGMQQQVLDLVRTLSAKDEIIRQLEDLKL